MTAAVATLVVIVAVVSSAACAPTATAVDVGLDGLAVTAVEPALMIPGTELVVSGRSFVPEAWGDTTLHLRGTAGGRPLDVAISARFVDYDHLVATVDADLVAAIGDGILTSATVEVISADDGERYQAELAVQLTAARSLSPVVTAVQSTGLVFVNDRIEVSGGGFLIGGSEGQTVAVVAGCTVREPDSDCQPGAPVAVPLFTAIGTGLDAGAGVGHRRDAGFFALSPAITGIEPGHFSGRLRVENRHPDGTVTATADVAVDYDLLAPAVFALSPAAVRLGQYLDIAGGGFVGAAAGASTTLDLRGEITDDDGVTTRLDLVLVAEVVDGRRARYVVSEDDALGAAVDLRAAGGVFTGTVRPAVAWAGSRVVGEPTAVSLQLAPPVQVVYLDFGPGYVEALRQFGLRAVDHEIRVRAVEVVRAAYAGVGVEVRTEPPADVALFSHVEIGGEDPNALGLFGYDNSPGKDSGNLRLHDRLGGVNARTQADGAPGYGGVFVSSLMGFSQHPAVGDPLPDLDPLFDVVFDPLRPDRGQPLVAADARRLVVPSSSAGCPAPDRAGRAGCAVWALGALIGTTIAHEVGHSLGLARPYDTGFHHAGDRPDRLMDAGNARPLRERAELMGQGPGRFCDDEYVYLRTILPAPDTVSSPPRPACD
jgi:hypothetical protein